MTPKNSEPQSENAAASLLTDTQREILTFIRETCRETGSPPSYREIQSHFGYKAVGTVQDHVKALIKKGALEEPEKKRARRSRTLVPHGMKGEGLKRISIYGEIAAGSTRDQEQLELGMLAIEDSLAKDPCFALRVVGNSMIGAGILEGDVLVVERTERAKNGDIVVALLDGETTVKRYEKTPDGVFLVPENPSMKPIPVPYGRLQIQGRVVALQRKIQR